jgi:hypothetical protein
MTARLASALVVVLAGPVAADDRIGALIDALAAPAEDAAALTAALDAQGFSLTGLALTGPEALPDGISDPFYFNLAADVSDQTRPGPLILLQCSRIGSGLLPHLPSGAMADGVFTLPVVPLLQWAETADFLPGAASQLRCLADLLPVSPDLAPLALPDRDAVLAALRQRFTGVAIAPLVEGVPRDGWVFYPPLTEPNPPPPLADGPVVMTAAAAPSARPGEGLAVRYEHRGPDALHSLQIVSHRPPGAD